MIIPDPMCVLLRSPAQSPCMYAGGSTICRSRPFDVYRQVQALRSLGRAGAERDESGG